MNCHHVQLPSMPLILSYLPVILQLMQLMLDCLLVQFLSMSLIMNSVFPALAFGAKNALFVLCLSVP